MSSRASKRNYIDKKPTHETEAKPDKENSGDITRFIKDEEMISVLSKKGITKLFPIQYETFDYIYSGKDIVAKDRTGSGKTMAFSLPIICKMREKGLFKKPHTTKFLIVLPTRELAIQVKDEIESLRIRGRQDFTIGAVYGGSRIEDQKEVVNKGLDIIVGTPGRMIDFLNRGVIKLDDIQATCLDEADEMLKQGFKEDIEQIFEHVHKSNKKTQNLLFSATIPEWIWTISDRYQTKDRPFIDLVKDKAVRTSPTVEHFSLKAGQSEKEIYLSPIIDHFLGKKKGKVIIFCETKREVDRIGNSSLLSITRECLHGDIKQAMRQRTFRKFKKGEIDCIIATNVAARGLDFPAIDLVIQMAPPKSTEDYIHRSGRTGRAGKKGVCMTLFSQKEDFLMQRIENETKVLLHELNQHDLKKKNDNREPREESKVMDKPRQYQRDQRDKRENSERKSPSTTNSTQFQY